MEIATLKYAPEGSFLKALKKQETSILKEIIYRHMPTSNYTQRVLFSLCCGYSTTDTSS